MTERRREKFLTKRLAERSAELVCLRAALEEIINPLQFMRERAEAQGARLNGMAYSIANSVSHLQGIAKAALGAGGEDDKR